MNSSVQDSANLAWKIALVLKGHASKALLETYTTERVPVIQEMLGRTTRLLNRTMRPGEERDEGWQRGGVLNMLSIHFRWSPIVLDERRTPPTKDERLSACEWRRGAALRSVQVHQPHRAGLCGARS